MSLIPVVQALLLGYTGLGGPDAVTLKYLPPVGKTYVYRMSMDMSMTQGPTPPMKIKSDVDVQTKIVSRTGDVTSTETRYGNPAFTFPANSPLAGQKDQMAKSLKDKVVTAKYDSHYNSKGSGGGGGLDAMPPQLSNVQFPNHPINVGDAWTNSVDLGKAFADGAGPMGGAIKMTGTVPMKFALKKVYMDGGRKLAQITSIFDGNVSMAAGGQAAKMHIKGSSTFSIEVSTGVTVQTNSVATTTITVGTMNMVQSATSTLKLK